VRIVRHIPHRLNRPQKENTMAKDHPTGRSGLYHAILQLETPEQCYRFLQDICSYAELSAMEQRYDIAEMLVAGRIYTDIMEKTGASSAIISRVSRMLAEENGELRPILEKERSAQET
jgi:TrpR-related protein YerC/YecD